MRTRTHWRSRSGVLTAPSVGRYRDDLGEEQLEDVLAEAGELLRELGYTGDGTPGAV